MPVVFEVGLSEEKRNKSASVVRKNGSSPKEINAGFGATLEESLNCLESPMANNERGEEAGAILPASQTMRRELKESADKSETKRYVPTVSSPSTFPFSLDRVSLYEGLSGRGGGGLLAKITRL